MAVPREIFRPTTFPQRVVHNRLWIAVDMWRTRHSVVHMGPVGISCLGCDAEKGKTAPNGPVEARRVTSYVANRRPDVPTSNCLVRGSAGLMDEGSSGLHRRADGLSRYRVGMSALTAIQLPIAWNSFDWPEVPSLGGVALTTGDPRWSWAPSAPALPILTMEAPEATTIADFTIDHVVLLVPHLDVAIGTFDRIGLAPRLKMQVGDRPAAFFRAGPVFEVIESPVRQASIYGLAVTFERSLESLALAWKARGLSVGTVKEAIQPGRKIMTIHDLDAGFAVMSQDLASPL